MRRQPNKGEYLVEVVIQSGPLRPRWEWEIYRDGQPLPIRLREADFKTPAAALAAGNIALREFLKALAREQDG
jgi:hypothetical protein